MENFSWKRLGIYVVAVVLIFGAGTATGHWVTPPRTVVTEKVKEVEKQVVVVQTKTEIKTVYVHDKTQAEKVHRVVAETTNKDGTSTKTTTEDINVDTVVHDNTNTNTETVKYVDRIIEKQVEKFTEKKVLNAPDWRVAAGVGIAIPTFLGHEQVGIPGLQGAVIQVELDRRIIGPFFLGAWANSQGTLGLNISGVF